MVKKFWKKITASILTLAMSLSMMVVVPVQAANKPLEFSANKTYAAVFDGKTINIKSVGWQTRTTVDGDYVADGNKVSNQSLLKFTPLADQSGLSADEVKVKIEYVGIEGETYPIRTEGGNEFVFADSDKRQDACEYVIKKTDDNVGTIQDTTRNYYFSIKDNGEIERVADKDKATEFTFIENPTVVDFTVYIEHVITGKYVKANGVDNPLTVDGEKTDGVIGDDLRWTPVWGNWNGQSVTFNSKATPGSRWRGGNTEEVIQISGSGHGGWESIRIVPNGNGSISFKDTADGKFFTVKDNKMVKTNSTESSDENGEFIIHTITAPDAVTGVEASGIEDTEITVSWDRLTTDTFYTGYKVVAEPTVTSGKKTVISDETANNSIKLKGLEKGTEYNVKVLTVNADAPNGESESITVQTKNGPRPVQATGLTVSETNKGIKVEWNSVENSTSYDVYRAESAFGDYKKIASDVTSTSYDDERLNKKGKYYNYYKVIAKNENGESDLSDDYASLEKKLFGENIIIFAETDDKSKVNKVIQDIFVKQNSTKDDAQFNGGHYAIYFKPGDYTGLECIPVGFYTHIGGLGKIPTEVKLNNIEVPAYLDGNATSGNHWADDGDWRNATCNFWRSAENISVVGTGNATVADKLSASTDNNKKDQFNWSVAQAAPLRRVYSTRNVSYDWAYGWASGGYTADCYFTGDAKTASGQQYFTRNSKVEGDATGTNLNNFNIGVVSNSLPNASTGDALVNENGYSNWSVAGENNGQQVITNITQTPKSQEKPFLFIDDDGEYRIFVPTLQENTSGVSWGEGKANDGMGEGKIMSLDDFYIAKEGDTAKTINEQLEAEKNIFFTPGVYHAEDVIKFNKSNQILLGTGMATIIPDNEEAAMEVADKDGIIVSGLIFDAGTYSKYLLKVGSKKTNVSHEKNPILLQDLFFRVGGTTSELTKADDALEINSNDVLCDHFWIWRADHGAGVKWNGNESKHGLIVNGDNVSCYALFNEHFQEYDTLWNGENGATYFYQNEKCYDPISQKAWMSHNGTVNGYAAYKVANNVKNHYAIGLGIYNVFIYTGESYDASEVQIQMDNAIEVPNAEGVIVENACIQTFAKADGVLQKFNHIINGVGDGVSSGKDASTGEVGEGWARKFLISYNNGTAIVGKTTDRTDAQKGKYIGVETLTDVKQLGEEINLNKLQELNILIENNKNLSESDYTTISWATYAKALEDAKYVTSSQEYLKYEATQDNLNDVANAYTAAINGLVKVADKTELQNEYDKDILLVKDVYTSSSWNAFVKALEDAKVVLDNKNATQMEVTAALTSLITAKARLQEIVDYEIIEGQNQTVVIGNTAEFRSNADFNKFVAVKVDGEEIASENYTVKEGVTAVILTAEYVNTLNVGEHTLTIVSSDGEASTVFTVKKDTENGKPSNSNEGNTTTGDKPSDTSKGNSSTNSSSKTHNTKTGDDNAIALFVTLGLLSAGIFTILRKKREN